MGIDLLLIAHLFDEKNKKRDEIFAKLKVSDENRIAIHQAIDDATATEKEFTKLILEEIERNLPLQKSSIDPIIMRNDYEPFTVERVF